MVGGLTFAGLGVRQDAGGVGRVGGVGRGSSVHFFFFLLVSVLERAAKGMAPWFAPDGLGHAGVAALGQPRLR